MKTEEPKNIGLWTATKEIEYLSEMLQIPKENILVVGSLALRAHGFPVEIVSDIDLEIKGVTPEQMAKIALLKEASRFTIPETYIDPKNRHDFIFRSFKYNVWEVKEFSHNFCWLDHVKYANPLSVLKVKMSYKRTKDIDFLKKLMLSIFEA